MGTELFERDFSGKACINSHRENYPIPFMPSTIRLIELKIPPPVVALVIAFAMWGIARALLGSETDSLVRLPIAGTLVAIGVAFDISGLLAFRRAKTTVNPMKPGAASSLVQSGVYRITRNPMYVGLFLFLCAWAAYLWSLLALVGPFAFAGYISRFQIVPEERILSELFGAEYIVYKSKVRRWL